MRRTLLILTACLWVSNCGNEIADETYATTGRKSINGIDAFEAEAKATGHTVVHTAYLSQEAQKADLIIHFEKAPGYPENIYRQVEAWMSGLEPEDLEEDGEIVRAPVDLALARKSDKRRHQKPSFAPETKDPESAEPESEENLEEDSEETDADVEVQPADDLRQVVFIYFLRDSDSSIEFWTRLTRQMNGHPAEKQYCELHLAERKGRMEDAPEELPSLFGTRMLLNSQKFPKLARDVSSEELQTPSSLPYRYLQLALPELTLDAPFHFRTLVDGDGQDLIREFYLNRGRVILVYNAAAFLNWPMARAENSAFARDLLRYALKGTEKGRIAFIDKLPVPPAAQADEEQNPFRLFTVFPLSVIFFQLLVFLLIFLLARARAGQPLRSEPPHGSRDFTEHFKALGNLLKKGKLE